MTAQTTPAVIGLDLSITATGVALPHGQTITILTHQAGDRRLLTIAEAIRSIVSVLDVTLAVVEDLPTHAHAAGVTGMVHGVVRTILLETGVPYALLTPATLKAYATGAGTSGKTAMALAAYKRARLEFDDDNQCDAWWLRAAGLDRLGHPEISLPAAQRVRLDKATWPDMAMAR